ncbi:MAG: GatB/YqeY domain-containing protein [Flavobacteriia bacterium]|nr:GatB/YqeY domain-containing protein [Flavobacteriia bacterium]OJX38535.1 MAG: glutamyl-tRNA amidotransferase [Flavobacteriia bacterium 40-80]
MSFTDRINADIKAAMLAKEKEKLAALRDIKSKLLLEATSGNGGEVSDETALKICMKLHKQRMETYELYKQQNREDLAQEELLQAQIIEEYLPKMLSEDEIREEVKAAIAETGASSAKEMGKVMGVLTSKLAGKADGKVISSIVKELLS